MKAYKYILLVLITMIVQTFAEEEVAISQESLLNNELLLKADDTNIQNVNLENLEDIKNASYGYWQLGTSVLLQEIGFGSRLRQVEKKCAHDWNFNLRLPVYYPNIFIPSIKYSYLMYKKASIKSSYFGLGFETASVLIFHEKPNYYPNIQLIWGTERDKVKFSQLEINVLPSILFLYMSSVGGWGKNKEVVGYGLIGFSAVGFSYKVGF